MTGRLAGKTAIITGAARGAGAAIARQFVVEGATVVVTDVLDERGHATAAALGATYRHLDVTNEDDWTKTIATLDRLDIVVNNAAVLHLATIDLTTAEAFEHLYRVNVLGAFLGTKAALPAMRAHGNGSIVNVGSVDSVHGAVLASAYTASKFALRGFTKVTALENARFGIRANIVCHAPGSYRGMHPPIVGAEDWPSRHESPGFGPEAIAPAVVYFASDESLMCNGTELVLDSAMTAGESGDLPDSLYGISG